MFTIHFIMPKIVRIAGLCYDTIIRETNNNLTFTSASYEQKLSFLFENSYHYSNSFSSAMSFLGYDATELIYDHFSLQNSWAKENKFSFNEKNWSNEILIAQLKKLKPEIVYFQDILSLSYETRKNIKKIIPSIKLVVIFRGFPGTDEKVLKDLATADLLIVGSPVLYKKCKSIGLQPYLIYHWFDDKILKKIKNTNPSYDFTFAGTSGYGYGINHYPRYLFLLEMMKKSNLELWIYEPSLFFKQRFRIHLINLLGKIPSFLIKPNQIFPKKANNLFIEVNEKRKIGLTKDVSIVPLKNKYPNRIHPPLFGIEMYQLFANSKISLNYHSTPAKGFVDNLRLFQSTGVGSCLLSDDGENMKDLFIPGEEILTYSSEAECLEKVNFLLEHENIRKKIAFQGQKKTLECHTVLNRCQQIKDLIKSKLATL